jgi:hypothetical protein
MWGNGVLVGFLFLAFDISVVNGIRWSGRMDDFLPPNCNPPCENCLEIIHDILEQKVKISCEQNDGVKYWSIPDELKDECPVFMPEKDWSEKRDQDTKKNAEHDAKEQACGGLCQTLIGFGAVAFVATAYFTMPLFALGGLATATGAILFVSHEEASFLIRRLLEQDVGRPLWNGLFERIVHAGLGQELLNNLRQIYENNGAAGYEEAVTFIMNLMNGNH